MVLYHYCSLHTLCVIVNSIKDGNVFLKASNAKDMNDPNDCYYFVNVIGQMIHASKDEIDNLFYQNTSDALTFKIFL